MPMLKLAVIRDPQIPPFQPAAMWLDCPCGTRIVLPEPFTSRYAPCVCGAVYDSSGWLVQGGAR